MEYEKADFVDTLKILAKDAWLNYEDYQQHKSPEYDQRMQSREKIKRINKLTQEFFQIKLKEDKEAFDYLLTKRWLSPELIESFHLWYAPKSNYELTQFLKQKKFSDEDMIEAGVAKKGSSGDTYSFFQHRIIFPIVDHMENVIWFGGRIIDPKDNPKYLNTAENSLYEKSKTLYGISLAKKHIHEFKAVIVVEGYMDVIALHKIWLPIGVAPCGTAMTVGHIQLLKKYTDTIYLLFDNDGAGFEATKKAVKICYEQEIYPQILSIPSTVKDIDEWSLAWGTKESLLDSKQEAFHKLLDRASTVHDTTSALGRKRFIEELFAIIQPIHDRSILSLYLEQLSSYLRIPYDSILKQFTIFLSGNHHIRPEREKATKQQFSQSIGDIVYALYTDSRAEKNLDASVRSVMNNYFSKIDRKQLLTPPSSVQIHDLQLYLEKEFDALSDEKKQQALRAQIKKRAKDFFMLMGKQCSDEDKNRLHVALLELTKHSWV